LDEIQRKKEADLIDRAPRPPIPSEDDQPIRILRNSGWREYKTIGGRLVFVYSLLQTFIISDHTFSISIWECHR
jgi:hypothetical protein